MKKRREDYPELEGMDVIVSGYESHDDEQDVEGTIALVSRAIGFTILERGSKTAIVFCLNMKNHVPQLYDEEMYHKQFDYMVEFFKSGQTHFRYDVMDDEIGYVDDGSEGTAVCAFV